MYHCSTASFSLPTCARSTCVNLTTRVHTLEGQRPQHELTGRESGLLALVHPEKHEKVVQGHPQARMQVRYIFRGPRQSPSHPEKRTRCQFRERHVVETSSLMLTWTERTLMIVLRASKSLPTLVDIWSLRYQRMEREVAPRETLGGLFACVG